MKRETLTRALGRPWFRLLFLSFLLLPVLFQTALGFWSAFRASWELAYFLLAAAGTVSVCWLENTRSSLWTLLWAAAAGAGACMCQNIFLSVGLAGLAAALFVCGRMPVVLKVLGWVGLALLLGVLGLRLVSTLSDTKQYLMPQYWTDDARRYAVVTVRDPGAAGRMRYDAVEQYELFSVGDAVRIGIVTGEDSDVSGLGRYGGAVDRYFEEA